MKNKMWKESYMKRGKEKLREIVLFQTDDGRRQRDLMRTHFL